MTDRWYTCRDDFDYTAEQDAGEAIYQHLDDHYPLDPYEKLPVHVTLYEWEASGDGDELVEVARSKIHVATWCKENAPDMMKDCVAPGEEQDE